MKYLVLLVIVIFLFKQCERFDFHYSTDKLEKSVPLISKIERSDSRRKTIVNTSKRSTYSMEVLEEENDTFRTALEAYATKFNHELKRNHSLDSLASKRGDYYLAVLQASASDENWITELIDHIPHGSDAHNRIFGTPEYFKEPDSVPYQELFVDVPDAKRRACCEIMDHAGSRIIDDYRKDNHQFLKEGINNIKKKFTMVYHLYMYQHSEHHNEGIIKYGNGEYGSCCRAIVHTWFWKKKMKWVKELVIYNSVIFSKPMKDNYVAK